MVSFGLLQVALRALDHRLLIEGRALQLDLQVRRSVASRLLHLPFEIVGGHFHIRIG